MIYSENDADKIIGELGLKVHPENGWFREIYSSEIIIPRSALPKRYTCKRSAQTSIYYLLEAWQYTSLHRLKTDELWHFYIGTPLSIEGISLDGEIIKIELGNDILNGQRPFAVIPAGTWFGAKLLESKGFSLAGCTLAPGFDFDDWELAEQQGLLNTYPQHEDFIKGWFK